MARLLKDPCGKTMVSRPAHASAVFDDIRGFGGNLQAWFSTMWMVYQGRERDGEHEILTPGAPHFFETASIKEEHENDIEIIDLTVDEVIDLTGESDDETIVIVDEEGREVIDLTNE